MKRLVLIAIIGLIAFTGHAADTNKVVNYGFRLGANMSQPLLKGLPINLTSTPALGGEGTFFMDYNIGKHFAIRFGINYTLERSLLTEDGVEHSLRSWGIEIPIFATVRFGNNSSGWGYVGFGPYTQFIIGGSYSGPDGSFNPYHHVIDVDPTTGAETLAMTDSHSGLGTTVGYELPCGLFFDVAYRLSLSDMLAFDHNETMSVKPHRVTLGAGWRF